MGSVVTEKRPLENGDSSLLLSLPRYKRRKVSAIRDFPDGCGPKAVGFIPQEKQVEISGHKAGGVFRNVESSAEHGTDLSQVVNKANLKEKCASRECVTDNNVAKERFDLKEAGHAIVNEVADVVTGMQPCLLPHYPMPLNFVWKEPKYPPRRKVSAIRDFPIGCGGNVPKLGDVEEEHVGQEETGSKSNEIIGANSANIVGGLSQAGNVFKDEGDVLVTKEGVDNLKLSSEEKLEFNGNDERDTSHLSNEHNEELVVYVKDKRKRKESIGDPGRLVSLQEESIVGFGSGNKKVNVQGLMSALHCPWRKGKGDVKAQPTTGTVKKPKGKKKSNLSVEDTCESSPNNNEDDTKNLAEKSLMVIPYLEDLYEVPRPLDTTDNDEVPRPQDTVDIEESTGGVGSGNKRIVVLGLMSALHCPWRQGKGVVKTTPTTGTVKKLKGKKKSELSGEDKHKISPNNTKDDTENLAEKSLMRIPYLEDVDEVPRPLDTVDNDEVPRPLDIIDIGDSSENDDLDDFQLLPRGHAFDISLPPFGVNSSSERGMRSKVRETLRLFQALNRKLLQEEETKSKDQENESKRTDLRAATILKDRGKYVNTEKVIGSVPGVEVGDIFNYRTELAVIGLHGPLQGGIDTIKIGKEPIAISIVASGGYANDLGNSDALIYTGQGGNASGKNKQPEDQKLEKGNLALKNCIYKNSLVRVIRGFKEAKSPETPGGRSKTIATYIYDGLYTVDTYWHDLGPHGKLVYKFELKRVPGQPELAWKEVKHSKNFMAREGRCVADISGRKESVPICAINTIDDEKPPSFTYITSMMYPNWCQPIPSKGCNCRNGCSDSEHCACALRNGGEIPFNYSGAIVQAKPLVYECGPLCKCPPSCHNRVSQHGIKLPLEVFKTNCMGWGVRCLSAISSGSFICEYIGELLDDKEAEQRTGSDEYLFDIGQNYNDTTLWDGLSALLPDLTPCTDDVVDVGFTIDAAKYGNIGRFINHSCTPNLYAQNVLYDHEDKRIPHIMLFAAENIPPLQELTYHYNYTLDQVFDSEGKIKKKSCYCGSLECTGRLY